MPSNTLMRNTRNLLTEETFYYQFGNQHKVEKPKGRRKTYLCYQLKFPDGSTLDRDYVKNKKKKHAEIKFIDKISSLDLDQTQRYKITCYITWSPCPSCAEELVAFQKNHPDLSLQLFTSRLYCHWLREQKTGLRQLWKSNIPVLVMGEPEFADCWENFVDKQTQSFKPWEKLTQYSETTKRRLLRILGINRTNLSSEESSVWIQDQNDLVDAIRNLNLDAPPPQY